MNSMREDILWHKLSYKHIFYIHIMYIYIYIYMYENKVNIYAYMYILYRVGMG